MPNAIYTVGTNGRTPDVKSRVERLPGVKGVQIAYGVGQDGHDGLVIYAAGEMSTLDKLYQNLGETPGIVDRRGYILKSE